MMVHALTIGPLAADCLADKSGFLVIAKFARSLHLQSSKRILCLVDAALGDGPLNMTVSAETMGLLDSIEVGAQAMASSGFLRFSQGQTIEFSDAQRWQPPVHGWHFSCAVGEPQWRIAVETGFRHAPPDSFFHAAFPTAANSDDLLMRAARQRIAALMQWLRSGEGEAPVTPLLGLGRGLTPAGDDLIGGLLLALHAMQSENRLNALVRAITAAPELITTLLSRNLLHAACQGLGHAYLHDLVFCLQHGDVYEIQTAAGKMDLIGHGSGWDALAGFLSGVAAMNEWTMTPSPVESCAA